MTRISNDSKIVLNSESDVLFQANVLGSVHQLLLDPLTATTGTVVPKVQFQNTDKYETLKDENGADISIDISAIGSTWKKIFTGFISSVKFEKTGTDNSVLISLTSGN
jgi:hypothetical protein